MKKAIIVIRNSDGQAMMSMRGEAADIDAAVARQAFDWTKHHVHECDDCDHYDEFSEKLHRTRKCPVTHKVTVHDPAYVEARAKEYPAIAAQLDALWHAMKAGEIPMATEFFEANEKVKLKHPKTS